MIAFSLLWVLFGAVVLALFILDFVLITKWTSVSEFKRSVVATSIIIGAAILFAIVLSIRRDTQYATLFLTGYLIELALSIDNIFVFILIFEYFKVTKQAQQRVLLIGIWSAIVMRFMMISFGIVLISKFTWVFYIFGAFLIYSAYKMIFSKSQEEEVVGDSKIVLLIKKYLPFTDRVVGNKFIVKQDGKWHFTPLFLVLIFVEKADLIFALDSIPAILAITDDIFIVFTSNVFAILGLRSIYHVLANFMSKFVYLKYALAFILGYIGVKMIASVQGFHTPIAFSLSVILCAVIVAVIASILKKPNQKI